MFLRSRLFLALLIVALPAIAQDRAAEVKTAFARAQHLRHGINASEWFAQSSNYSAQQTNSYTDDSDIALMAQIGFDNVRLSIDAAPLTQLFVEGGVGEVRLGEGRGPVLGEHDDVEADRRPVHAAQPVDLDDGCRRRDAQLGRLVHRGWAHLLAHDLGRGAQAAGAGHLREGLERAGRLADHLARHEPTPLGRAVQRTGKAGPGGVPTHGEVVDQLLVRLVGGAVARHARNIPVS